MGTTPAALSSFEENRQSRELAALLSLEMFTKERTCPGPWLSCTEGSGRSLQDQRHSCTAHRTPFHFLPRGSCS